MESKGVLKIQGNMRLPNLPQDSKSPLFKSDSLAFGAWFVLLQEDRPGSRSNPQIAGFIHIQG